MAYVMELNTEPLAFAYSLCSPSITEMKCSS